MFFFGSARPKFNARAQHLLLNPLTAKLFNWNFHPLEVWIAPTSSEWKLCRFDKLEVNSFQIVLTDGFNMLEKQY